MLPRHLAGEKPEKKHMVMQKEKNYADISETKGKAIAFANRSSDPGCLLLVGILNRETDWTEAGL